MIIDDRPTHSTAHSAAGWQGDAEHLRIWCGGEAMTCDLARQLLPRCAALWNMYGPTETTVWASALRVTLEHTQGSSIPVGRSPSTARAVVRAARAAQGWD